MNDDDDSNNKSSKLKLFIMWFIFLTLYLFGLFGIILHFIMISLPDDIID